MNVMSIMVVVLMSASMKSDLSSADARMKMKESEKMEKLVHLTAASTRTGNVHNIASVNWMDLHATVMMNSKSLMASNVQILMNVALDTIAALSIVRISHQDSDVFAQKDSFWTPTCNHVLKTRATPNNSPSSVTTPASTFLILNTSVHVLMVMYWKPMDITAQKSTNATSTTAVVSMNASTQMVDTDVDVLKVSLSEMMEEVVQSHALFVIMLNQMMTVLISRSVHMVLMPALLQSELEEM
jgi:hypothetical protein